MSVRLAFGLGFGVGAGVSLLLGAPFAPAIVYGLLTGGLSALVSSMNTGPRAVLVAPTPVVPAPWYTRIGFSYLNPRPRSTVVVHNNTSGYGLSRPNTWFSGSSWFPTATPSNSGSVTTVHQGTGSAPVAVTTTPTQAGGTVISSSTAVPARARNVRASTTLFGNTAQPVPVPSTPVSVVTTGGSSILGATPVIPPTARNVRQTTTLLSPSVSAPAPTQSSLFSGLSSFMSTPSVVPPTARNVRVTTTTTNAPSVVPTTMNTPNARVTTMSVGGATTTPSGTFLATNPHAPRPVSGSIMSSQPNLPAGAHVTSVQRKLF